jgi:hypothetical protein
MTSPFLTEILLEEEHAATDYLSWVQSLIARVKQEHDGLERIRLRKGLAKELMNEALPIGRLASKYFSDGAQVTIQLKIGNQNYDAIVHDRGTIQLPVRYIEVTVAGDGESDYLRMRKLHETGEASGFGRISKDGTKHRRGVDHDRREMVSQEWVLRQESEKITRAISRKIKKEYPDGTLLLIAFNDEMAFGRPDNISNIESTISALLPSLIAFHSVAVVGQRGLFLSWRTGSAF